MLEDTDLSPEWHFRTSRSGGSGGQHVNKTETRVELIFNVPGSNLLSEEQKQRILNRLGSRISAEGDLRIVVDASRSQHKNRETAEKRFYEMLEKALEKKAVRKKTRVPRAVKEKRLQAKRQRSEKKQLRRKGPDA